MADKYSVIIVQRQLPAA